MQTIQDDEFGEIAVRRSALARYVRIKVGQDGRLSASLPLRTPLKSVTQLLEKSRDELRPVLQEFAAKRNLYKDGSLVGKSHTLHVKYASTSIPKSRIAQQQITVYLPLAMQSDSSQAQQYITSVIKRVLKKEAEAYLPRRVKHLANEYDFKVGAVRFNNASSRWGSCSSGGSINLNIALMKLPFELIDYVIIHELCHTKHMNHSAKFWDLVVQFCPDFKDKRKSLHQYHPYI